MKIADVLIALEHSKSLVREPRCALGRVRVKGCRGNYSMEEQGREFNFIVSLALFKSPPATQCTRVIAGNHAPTHHIDTRTASNAPFPLLVRVQVYKQAQTLFLHISPVLPLFRRN